jgi:elongator complex protein 1
MRNLRRLQLHRLDASFAKQPISNSAWDHNSGSLIIATGPSQTSPNIHLWRLQKSDAGYAEPKSIALWDLPGADAGDACDRIVGLQYLSESASCCVVLACGDVIVVKEDPLPGEERIEIVGTVDDGIAATRWSPDEQLLAIVTGSGSLTMMSADFDLSVDFKFTAEDLKASKHVSVGWGKAETQFKGKRAKALRDPTVPEHVDEGLLSSTDDHSVSISWRGDGEYLAVNSVESSQRRIVRIFARDGTLNSVSEPVDFLQASLSWRPAGNLIAAVKRHERTAEVVFFERNGLKHGGFPLRLEKSDMDGWASRIALDWNADSTVLAVSYCDRVQLWTMGNYHYYLKQTVMFNADQGAPIRVNWNQESPLSLAAHNDGTLSTSASIALMVQASCKYLPTPWSLLQDRTLTRSSIQGTSGSSMAVSRRHGCYTL